MLPPTEFEPHEPLAAHVAHDPTSPVMHHVAIDIGACFACGNATWLRVITTRDALVMPGVHVTG